MSSRAVQSLYVLWCPPITNLLVLPCGKYRDQFSQTKLASLRSFNISEGLVQAIKALYENSSSAVLLNSRIPLNSRPGEFFKTKVCVHQGYLLWSILLNLFLEKIILETLHDHKTSISCNLRFSDDDRLGDSSGELQDLTNRLVDRATAYGMEVSTEKSNATSVQILAWTAGS